MVFDEQSLSRSMVDRLSDERSDPALLKRVWADPATRVLRWCDGLTPSVRGGAALDLVAPVGPLPGMVVLLGRDAGGVLYVAARVEAAEEGWQDLRALGTTLGARDSGLLTQATAVLRWHASHPRCPRCGAATDVVQSGWVRRCTDDGSEHFPRTDPAVIMAVVDDQDRLLLGHNPAWPANRYSTLAGFVEPGESLEAAVRREVLEEVGVVIGEVAYLGNQPWPFPASLMLGFTARAVDATVRTDGVEITDARWFTREQLHEAVTSGSVVLPGGLSISHGLIRDWYGEDVPGGGEWR